MRPWVVLAPWPPQTHLSGWAVTNRYIWDDDFPRAPADLDSGSRVYVLCFREHIYQVPGVELSYTECLLCVGVMDTKMMTTALFLLDVSWARAIF